jgi:glyoxylate/hydroxypyruvate reductase A
VAKLPAPTAAPTSAVVNDALRCRIGCGQEKLKTTTVTSRICCFWVCSKSFCRRDRVENRQSWPPVSHEFDTGALWKPARIGSKTAKGPSKLGSEDENDRRDNWSKLLDAKFCSRVVIRQCGLTSERHFSTEWPVPAIASRPGAPVGICVVRLSSTAGHPRGTKTLPLGPRAGALSWPGARVLYGAVVSCDQTARTPMPQLNILTLTRLGAEDRAKIEAVDPAVRLTDAGGWFDGEYRESWPGFTAERYLAPGAAGQGTREQRDRLLAEAEVILGGWPFPLDLRARSPRLKWFHQRPAGASNLLRGDLWGSDVTVTTSRGSANSLAIAEYAIAGMLHLAKGLHRAAIDRDAGSFSARAYRPWMLDGKTACIVGAGGIGLEVGRLCAALGLRVAGTRRHPVSAGPLPPGFTEIGGAGDLDRLLPDSDVVAICCQWTPETNRLFNHDRFARMKPGSILVNVARGEIVDEDALADALARDHLRGAALDVYTGEFEHAPKDRLWADPRVLITPHISGASDHDRHGGIDLFRDNLRAWIDRKPLRNVIDWARGY